MLKDKVSLQNLEIIVTEKCNLNCSHCERGKCSNKFISDNIIRATLDQTCWIGNLSLGGGEPLFALARIEKIFSYIVDNKILVDEFGLTTNATIYSEEFIRLYNYFEEYVAKFSEDKSKVKGYISVSYDIFHKKELERLDLIKQTLENIKRYMELKYFLEIRGINNKLFREGNAVNLPKNITIPLRPINTFITYAGSNQKIIDMNGLCNIGPLVCINVDGIITECNASYEHQKIIYNYGNVTNNSIEQTFLDRGAKILRPHQWARRINREVNRYVNYKH